jgi:hypothetical protein
MDGRIAEVDKKAASAHEQVPFPTQNIIDAIKAAALNDLSISLIS